MNIEVIYEENPLSSDQLLELSEYILTQSIKPPKEFGFKESIVILNPATDTHILQYQMNYDEPEPLEYNTTTLFLQQELPHIQYSGLLQQLYFDPALFKELINFPELVIEPQFALFKPSQLEVISYKDELLNQKSLPLSLHHLMLLEGSPGSGKTSVALAAFNEAAKRIPGVLLQVNAHALFSKWFSESGKIVQYLFTAIREICEEQPVYLLIDEVESLASKRTKANEPSDSVRAANAVLTQLDQLRQYQCAIICTSNLSGELDDAFVDRCDVVLEIGAPGEQQRREILQEVRDGIMEPSPQNCNGLAASVQDDTNATTGAQSSAWSTLNEVVALSDGMSGRMLRKLPVLALLNCFGDGTFNEEGKLSCTEGEFWGMIRAAIALKAK